MREEGAARLALELIERSEAVLLVLIEQDLLWVLDLEYPGSLLSMRLMNIHSGV